MSGIGKYILFAGYVCHPKGGMFDFKGLHNTVEEAINSIGADSEWAHVVDAETLMMVWCDDDGLLITPEFPGQFMKRFSQNMTRIGPSVLFEHRGTEDTG